MRNVGSGWLSRGSDLTKNGEVKELGMKNVGKSLRQTDEVPLQIGAVASSLAPPARCTASTH